MKTCKQQFAPFAGHQQGFTLLETLVATAIILVSVAAIFALGTQTFLTAQRSSDEFTAAFLAGEGIEIVRGLRDNNWLAGAAWDQGLQDGSYLVDYNDQALQPFADKFLKIDSNGFYQYDTGQATKFKRRLEISKDPINPALTITVTVSWDGSQLQVSDKLWNWK